MIELLVVIAIIALLAAILLPALSGARNRTKRIVCLNNQRTVGTSLIIMSDDNNGYCDPRLFSPPTRFTDNTLGLTITNWYDAVVDYLGGRADLVYPNWKGRPLACPGLRYIYSETTIYDYIFGINSHLGRAHWPDSSEHHPTNISRIADAPRPGNTYLISDLYWPWSTSFGNWTTTLRGGAAGVSYSERHEALGLSFLFVDGHGEFIRGTDGRFPINAATVRPLSGETAAGKSEW